LNLKELYFTETFKITKNHARTSSKIRKQVQIASQSLEITAARLKRVRLASGLLRLDRLAVLDQVHFERFNVVVKAQCAHCKQNVFAVDGLALLQMTTIAGLTRDEGNELGHTLLHTFTGVFGHLSVGRNGHFHDFGDVGDGQKPVLFAQHGRAALLVIGWEEMIKDILRPVISSKYLASGFWELPESSEFRTSS
jgi:hypothetical protein